MAVHSHTNMPSDLSDRSVDQRSCGICATPAIRGLWQTLCLNTFFTCAQFFGSIIANSLALGADTGTMLSDSITYLINIAAELFRIRGASHRACTIVDLCASGLSILCLVTVTAIAMKESIGRLSSMSGEAGSGGGDDEDVNPYVMFGFTAGNLIIDIGMIGSLVLRNRGGWMAVFNGTACRAVLPADDGPHASDTVGDAASTSAVATAQRNAPLLASAAVAAEEGMPVAREGKNAAESRAAGLNVFSAFAHVIADTMRTVTEMSCSLLIWLDPSISGERADAVSALLVCTIILLVVCFMVYEAYVVLRDELLKASEVRDSVMFSSASCDPLHSALANRAVTGVPPTMRDGR